MIVYKFMENNSQKSAIIVGGGIGGLCTAARLLKNGYKVTVIEKEDKVGGRANRIEKKGYTFDMGPTLLMMTDVLYDTFKYCGKNFDDYITLLQLEPNYRVAFADKSKITVSSNLPKFSSELEKFDPKGPEQFFKFFSDVSAMYRISRKSFIDRNFRRITDFINPVSGAQLLKRRGLSKLYDFVAYYFKDERLRQLFSFQSMYLGVSPHEAPAVYSMVSYMETGLGIWYPKGGMYSLSMAMEKLVKDLGGEILTSSSVEEIIIKDKKAVGVRLKKGRVVSADTIVANADLVYAQKELIDEKHRPSSPNQKLENYKQASSALLFYWGVDDPCEQMLHHNVYLCKDFKGNLEEIFHKKKLPKDPSFYTYIPTKTDPALAPKGKSVFYVLVPVPNLDSKVNWEKGIKRLKKQVISRLKTEFDLDIEKKIKVESVFTPEDFKNKYNLHVGSAFGLSHHFFQSGYFRPHNKSKDIKNLYFVGASTYPGGGIPMVTLSAKLVTERILSDAK
jgi:phytoene desaturase